MGRRGPQPRDPWERFLALVYRWEADPDNHCWAWLGTLNSSGYGLFRLGDKLVLAHRYSYEHEHGPIPEGYQVLHSCDIRWCVNPHHLSTGSQSANMRDALDKGRWYGRGVKYKEEH